MRTLVVLFSCLLLIGCTHQDAAPRWAIANKSQIDTAIYVWSRDKASESFTPDEQAQIRKYESEQSQKRVDALTKYFTSRNPPDSPPPAPNKDVDTPSKTPLAELVERNARKMEEYRNQFSAEKLTAEFAKDHFDLVIDSGQISSHSVALYNKTGEVMDITDGILNLFKEKTKQ